MSKSLLTYMWKYNHAEDPARNTKSLAVVWKCTAKTLIELVDLGRIHLSNKSRKVHGNSPVFSQKSQHMKKELRSCWIEAIVEKFKESKRQKGRGESGITKPAIIQNRKANKTQGQDDEINKVGKVWPKELFETGWKSIVHSHPSETSI